MRLSRNEVMGHPSADHKGGRDLGDDAVQRGRDRARGDDGGDGPHRHQANPTGEANALAESGSTHGSTTRQCHA